jgi:hypothetical protein
MIASMTKACRACGIEKPDSEFTRVKQNRDGLCSYCKACVRERSKKHYYEQGGREAAAAKSPGRWERTKARYGPVALAYSRSEKGKAVRRAVRKKWLASEAGKAWRREYDQKNRHKCQAADAVRYALRTGRLVRPEACSHCGAVGKITAHHHLGYAVEHRLHVQWLCVPCHRKADRGLLLANEIDAPDLAPAGHVAPVVH